VDDQGLAPDEAAGLDGAELLAVVFEGERSDERTAAEPDVGDEAALREVEVEDHIGERGADVGVNLEAEAGEGGGDVENKPPLLFPIKTWKPATDKKLKEFSDKLNELCFELLEVQKEKK